MKKIIITLLLLFIFPISILAYSEEVILGGNNIGIRVNTNGLLVVGFYKVENEFLNKKNIKIGDYLIKINDENIYSLDNFTNLINKYIENGKVNLTISRNGILKNVTLDLIESNGTFKTGLYVKDSLTGIGTITYVDPNTKVFGALGHEIIEGNTAKKVEIDSGLIYESNVTGIVKSNDGSPGSKNADIYFDNELGDIEINTESGIFGNFKSTLNNEKYKVATFDEIKLGDAYIYTVTKGNTIKKYKINITKLYKNKIDTAKSIAFIVTDKELLKEAGGIVQGMSGSPIVQDNKIIGAVTNVVVDQVNKGYAIFIRTMLENGDSILED